MGTRLRPLPFRSVDRALRALGFAAVRQAGSHVRYAHPDGRKTTLPHHPGRDLGRGLVRAILRDINVDWDGFEKRT